MEKIKSTHPVAYELYLKHTSTFETDNLLSEKILSLNMKNQMAVDTAVRDIFSHFLVVS